MIISVEIITITIDVNCSEKSRLQLAADGFCGFGSFITVNRCPPLLVHWLNDGAVSLI